MGSRSQEQRSLLTDYDAGTAYSQAFYTLFANIRFHWEKGVATHTSEDPATAQIHSLLIVSAAPHQEQATVAANLAIVAAQSGAETILVDADLHASELRRRFGLAEASGLGNVLASEVEVTPSYLESCLQPTFVPGLRLLGAGNATTPGAALLLSSRLEQVMKSLQALLAASVKSPGIVICHSTPVLSGADASLIGALTEQTVLTIIPGKTTRSQARQAEEQLRQAHVPLAGVVLLHA